MGCDINGVLQKRKPNTNEWTTFAPIERFFEGRSYLLFGILAGVRNKDAEVISDNRGLPEGFVCVDELHPHKPYPNQPRLEMGHNRYHTWMGEHNFGWVDFREFLDYNWKQTETDHHGEPEPLGIIFSWLHRDLYKICTEEKTQPEDLRMVFGFDS
mgnify:CR=1 FL=1|tara:strand:+ start:122 stop:589 length:468 start_codon:yes stop_codon:yes gene_type:complete